MTDPPRRVACRIVRSMKLTPMLEQYLRAKSEVPDALLLFRLGDFYELFFEDAETAARVLDITLTTRSKKDEVPIPMCGVPHHAVQAYVAKLLAAGFKVALCDQMEDASLAKGLVVARAGARGDARHGDRGGVPRSQAARTIWRRCGGDGDEVGAGRRRSVHRRDARRRRCPTARRSPSCWRAWRRARCLLDDARRRHSPPRCARALPAGDGQRAAGRALRRGGRARRGCARTATARCSRPAAAAALGAVLGYLADTHRASVDHLRPPEGDSAQAVMVIDEASRRNLELLATTRGERRGSLLGGARRERRRRWAARLLRQWMLAPLTDIAAIGARLDAVEALLRQPSRRDQLGRSCSAPSATSSGSPRASPRRGSAPRDLLGLAAALGAVERMRGALADVDAAALRDGGRRPRSAAARARAHRAHAGRRSAAQAAPRAAHPRRLPRRGRTSCASWRCTASASSREYEARERARTGIGSLKVRYNQVFGYYIEVTKPNLHLVPADYRRKQTDRRAASASSRPELEQYEAKVLGAEERARRARGAALRRAGRRRWRPSTRRCRARRRRWRASTSSPRWRWWRSAGATAGPRSAARSPHRHRGRPPSGGRGRWRAARASSPTTAGSIPTASRS